ncbi:DEAD/DEAH box helicase [Opitutus terrae]|uniref:DEAD/H associated domain protein n=1 Tax=Opitutus terrae (strain DSM 11246 / JCM 15787 / PB90-1) TaxID=452637 RepID=B1ZZM6_OPITP|nr:DEAD/DEAH box helicase [Opitutus terrae]ACB76427.1 DEAD/H associated domain protein [Opitutus terrae PB90-1]
MLFTRVTSPAFTESRLYAALHPDLAAWFRRRFAHFSPAQLHAVPEVLAGNSLLLTSPTGSGKTLAAFLSVFDWLARARDRGELPNGIVAVYVSPLRALAYDLRKNLAEPVRELGWDWLRVGARTGDTSPAERAAQRRKPPHIFVTTPESLTLMLSQPGWIAAFTSTRFLIADELHALAENKRGAMLAVAAERLEEFPIAERRSPNVPAPPPHVPGDPTASSQSAIENQKSKIIRIGLSATVAPLETVAAFLVGPGRPCRIAEVTQTKPAKIEVFSPLREHAYPPAGYTATRVLAELSVLLEKHKTTLVFTNTRSGAESIGLRLKQLRPELSDLIEVHHASLDRGVRLEIEDRLKRGELRAVVCSTSLEMGIDIGSIDVVVMVSAPKGVSRALQRIGRSGHSMGRISHGILVASNINDLAECAVTARMMARRELEPVKIHENPLDVLAQTLVGLAIFGSETPDEAFALVRRSYPFRDLPRATFERVLRYLRGGGVSLERNYENVFGKVRVDASGQLVLTSPRVARSFYQNIGTINTESMVQIRLGRRNLGQVEESFMRGLRPGDVFVLNGRCVRLVKTHLLSAQVVRADHALPTVPRWYANKMPLASGLAAEVVRLRTEVAKRLGGSAGVPPASGQPAGETPALSWLRSEYGLSAANARALIDHFSLQAQISAIPTAGVFLIERYREGDLLHYFFHALIGRSANDALSRIVAQRVQSLKGGNALVTIDDYGFLLSLRSFQAMEEPELRTLLVRDGAEDALRLALADASLVKWQFRGVAQTGLMVPRRVHGVERGTRMLQWSAEIIFEVLREHEPDHPLLLEAYAEATLRFLDLPRALGFLEQVDRLRWDIRDLPRVSPFSFGIYVSKIKETMTLEDPETTIERLYHAMYGANAPTAASSPT